MFIIYSHYIHRERWAHFDSLTTASALRTSAAYLVERNGGVSDHIGVSDDPFVAFVGLDGDLDAFVAVSN